MIRYISKRLHHDVPSWVSDDAIYHIRVRARMPGGASLIEKAGILMDSARFYTERGAWSCYLLLVMPDHLHALLRFGRNDGMARTVGNWKRYHANRSGLCWQDGFFDHRIRSHAEFSRSFAYIRNNPVVVGLCAQPDDWPWQISCVKPEGVPHF
mgnify:CR=1 FL=1